MNTLGLILYIAVGLVLVLALSFLTWIYTQFKRTFKQLDNTVEKIIHFSNRDPLTGLPNRTHFFEYVKNKLEIHRALEQKLAIFCLDIDHFRGIKDTFGYDVGDLLLKAVAKRLSSVFLNKKILVSRLSSDQFAIVIDRLDEPSNFDEEAKKILLLLSQTFTIQGHKIRTTASIGISIYPDDGNNIESLLKFAGIARHQAKELGSNIFSYYAPDMNKKLAEIKNMEFHLRHAISNKELSVLYQPKIDIHTRKILGAEALLRWNNPELGKISPAQFIPLAEHNGMIINIGNWVLKEACQQTKNWHDQGFIDFTIAINLSAYQFKVGDIAEQVANVIWDTKLNPDLLELEITECVVMENIEKSILMLRVLKSMGIKISIDDFGTGYSSLSQLRKFPVDFLKIDQSFVKNINHQSKELDDSAIITTIITMAKQLNLKVIAEGVETEAQFDFLKKEGCDLIQGYLFGQPVSAEEFTALLKKNITLPLN